MKTILRRVRFAQDRLRYLSHVHLGRNLPQSVYFYTLHKCASTLFSHYILKHIDGLYHVNYANQIYNSLITGRDSLVFRDTGVVYGPIRISLQTDSPAERLLIAPTTTREFVKDKRAIFFVRDPRDILVSSYYSFGFSHSLSNAAELRTLQLAQREAIQAQSVDEYVLDNAIGKAHEFKRIFDLAQACGHSVVTRYEDMIDDFDTFAGALRKHVGISDAVIRETHTRTRPKTKEDATSHRRSGKVGGFREKLAAETVDELNRRLAEVLPLFGYGP